MIWENRFKINISDSCGRLWRKNVHQTIKKRAHFFLSHFFVENKHCANVVTVTNCFARGASVFFFFSIPNYFERSFCPDFEVIRMVYVFFLHFFVDILQQNSGLLFISSPSYFVHVRQREVFGQSKEFEP